MTESPEAKSPSTKTKRVWEVSPFVVFGLCGFTLYLAWMFMIYISPTIAPEAIMTALYTKGDPNPYLSYRFFQVASLWVVLLIAWRASDALSSVQGVLAMLIGGIILNSAGFIILALLDSGTGTPDTMTLYILPMIASLLLGVGQAFMILLWSSFLCMIGENRILLFVALCIGCAAGLALLMSFLQPVPAIWITLTLALLSLICFAYIRFRLPETPKPLLVKAKTSDKRQNIHSKSAASVVIYSIGIGFSVCFIACSGTGMYGVVAVAVAVILASIIAGLDSTRFHAITEGNLSRLLMSAILIGFAPLFFDNLVAQVFGCAVLLCFFMIVFIVNLTALSEHVRIYRLNSIRLFGYGRAGNAFGFLLGGLICYITFFAPYSLFLYPLVMDQRTWSTILLLCLLGVFVLASAFVFEDHYPTHKGASKKIAQSSRTKTQEHKGGNLPRGDLHTLSTYMLAQPDDSEAGSGVWTKRVKSLSKEYELSPKETEVLFLLAKGRNAEYIQNELVVSRHTAKAHIYHIYQKTGVHSRQDLIDMLENVEVDYE